MTGCASVLAGAHFWRAAARALEKRKLPPFVLRTNCMEIPPIAPYISATTSCLRRPCKSGLLPALVSELWRCRFIHFARIGFCAPACRGKFQPTPRSATLFTATAFRCSCLMPFRSGRQATRKSLTWSPLTRRKIST